MKFEPIQLNLQFNLPAQAKQIHFDDYVCVNTGDPSVGLSGGFGLSWGEGFGLRLSWKGFRAFVGRILDSRTDNWAFVGRISGFRGEDFGAFVREDLNSGFREFWW